MTQKTYRAKSIPEAISRVRAELGNDAMILSTKRISAGPRNPYGAGFEVTAAPAPRAEEPKMPTRPRMASRREEPAATREPASRRRPLRDAFDRDRELDALLPEREPAPDKAPGMRQLQDEIAEIRNLLFVMSEREGSIPEVVGKRPEALGMMTRLQKVGISEATARKILDQADREDALQPAAFSRHVFEVLLKTITPHDPFMETGRRQVAAFVGPTGVGKTTTIAKLAADLALKQKRRIGLISIDSYRIGAFEQLKTYASIMGVPCVAAFSKDDLQKAMKQLRDREVILIDTAGLSHLDGPRMRELAEILGGRERIETHLVLSAATRAQDMEEAAESFLALNPRSYIFTKLDETRRSGGILEQLAKEPLPVSFVTNGQRVPEDIQPVTRKDLVRLIFTNAAD